MYRKKQIYWVIMWLSRTIFIALREKIASFCVVNFCKGIVQDLVKQTIWFLACWFFKHDIWTCCETLWVYVIFASIAAFFHSLFFLTVISFVAMDFQKFSRFFPVVRLSAFGDDKFLQNTFQFQIIEGGGGRQIT